MFWAFVVLTLNFGVVGALLCVLGLRSRTGLALNDWWGMRTEKTMVDAETFAKANRAIWCSYVFQGCVLLAAGLATRVVGIVDDDAYVLLGAIALGSVFVIFPSVFYGYIKAHRSIR
ncbi:MAG: SdpI family protein [Actinomycetaceae bacterium]|nr:SdpI family protein [Actinomycetaceae bacterium]MDY5854790.1 SdpI family protein [Arcanobacterium sp.]